MVNAVINDLMKIQLKDFVKYAEHIIKIEKITFVMIAGKLYLVNVIIVNNQKN